MVLIFCSDEVLNACYEIAFKTYVWMGLHGCCCRLWTVFLATPDSSAFIYRELVCWEGHGLLKVILSVTT